MTKSSPPDTLLLFGRVYRAHGLSGEIKVIPETDDPTRFEALSALYVGQAPDTARLANVQGVRYQHTRKGTLVILKLETIDSREEAETLRGALLYAPADALPELDADEFYLRDLVGLTVIEENGDRIGVVEDVLTFPGQDMLVIARDGQSSAMVPAVPEFVTTVDLEAGQITLRTIEGLLDE
jgi:16S rRNA processing protein RimM